jgi:prepilin-type N-terminal cleavage/methylation domain-containing protein
MRHKAGFTLIEIMVSLVLVGLIASIAGTLIITATRGYLYARENDAITQKAQLALGRINREFTELMDVKARNDDQPYIIYEVPLRAGGVERRGVAKVGNTVQMFFNVPGTTLSGLTGDILVDHVQTLSLMYNPSSGVSLWSMGQDIKNLFALSVQIVLNRPDTGGSVSFFTTVSPRNNNNSGGAALPTAANPPPEYSGKQCFVTTAAYGDADHPVVIVLRQFRDRFLLPTEPGKALVRCYYEAGPSLAAAIEDRPLACLLVRLLVTPVAGFALLALHCPVLIPVILLLSWGLSRLVLKALQRRSLRRRSRLQGQRGAMLVTLIAAMVVFATLGAVMIAMFGTAALSQASGNYSQRAYYLAESGCRYAASRYINVNMGSTSANETERNRLLKEDLHKKDFVLGAGDGKFQLLIYQYYYPVKSISSVNAQWLDTEVTDVTPGYPLSSSDFKNGSYIRIKQSTGDIHERILGASLIYPSTVQFTHYSGPWTGISSGDEVSPACKAAATTPIVSRLEDGITKYDLVFQDQTGANIFPEKNGVVMVTVQGTSNTRMLGYKRLDLDAHRLRDVTDPDGNPLPAVQPDSFVDLTKFMRVESTGTFGTGSAAVSRKVTYYTPIGYARATPISKTDFKESFDDTALANWFTGIHGSHIGEQAQSSSIGPALQFGSGAVTKTAAGTRYYEGQIGLNWSAANIPLPTEWVRASKYLSYDLQAKLYFNMTMTKRAAGLTFRLDESGNAIGLSYGQLDQGVDQYGRDKDFIPDPIVSSSSVSNPVITLWAKQYDKTDSTFTVVTNPNAGSTECTGHPERAVAPFAISSSENRVWETGFRVRFAPSGGAALPGNLSVNTDYFVRRIEGANYFYLFDTFYNAVAKDDSTTHCWLWNGIQKITSAGSGTVTAVNQDPAWTNLAYQALTTSNSFYGLYNTTMGNLVPWSTFLVRLIEAPSVSVLSTAGSTGREIVSGDTVYTTSDNSPGGTVTAIALVRRNPVYRSNSSTVRNWSGKTAEAVLILEPVKDTSSNTRSHIFGQGKTLFAGVEGAGVIAGVVDIPPGSTDIVYRDRDQWIAVYVADPTGPASSRMPDTDPFNIYSTSTGQYQRGRILRTSVRWPVEDIEYTNAANDFFTVVRFRSFVNSTLASCRVSGGSGLLDLGGTNCLGSFYSGNNNLADYPDILRFSSPDGVVFNSPTGTTFPTARPEVGLHNLGGDMPSFDDFALQFGPGYGIARQGFLLPIQQ